MFDCREQEVAGNRALSYGEVSEELQDDVRAYRVTDEMNPCIIRNVSANKLVLQTKKIVTKKCCPLYLPRIS